MPRLTVRLTPSLLTWLRSFEAAARHGSFTRAAEELHLTQGAISQQIRRLEEWLTRPLFVRNAGHLHLSAEGRRLQAVTSKSLRAIETALGELRNPADDRPITVGCAPSLALRWLTPRLGGFFRNYPAANVQIHGEVFSTALERMLHEGEGGAIRFGNGNYHGMRATMFLDEWIVPVASPGFLSSRPGTISPHELQGQWLLHDTEPWIGAPECAEWLHWLKFNKLEVSDLDKGRRFNLSQLATSAAIADQGIALGRLAVIFDDLEAGRLVPLFNLKTPATGNYWYVCAHGHPPASVMLENWLLEEGARFRKARAALIEGLKYADGTHVANP